MKSEQDINKFIEYRDNSVGNKINEKIRKEAKSKLDAAKQEESEKIKNGYVWMVKFKTAILIPPKKIKKYLDAGFNFTKK